MTKQAQGVFNMSPEQFVNALMQVAAGAVQNPAAAHQTGVATVQAHQEQLVMVELAGRAAVLDEQIKQLQRQKKQLTLNLLPLIQKHGTGSKVTLADGTEVIACVQHDKRAKKEQITAFFGVEKAQSFWSQIDSKVREYLSIKRPNATVEEEEEDQS